MNDHNPRKRRRLDAAATLSKPFKSPLRRPISTEASLPTLTSDPATQNAIQPASPVQTNHIQEKAATTPKFSPVVRRQIPGSIGLTTPTQSSADPELLDLQKQQLSLQSRLTALRTDRDTIHQALRIESSNQDLELEALIIKWRRAGQDAAEEVFSNAQERVTRMGGIAAWMERSKRDAMRWDDEEPQAYDKNSDSSPQEEMPDVEFTMAFMLKTLNIELETIGYDPTMVLAQPSLTSLGNIFKSPELMLMLD
ncbi:hypothetical protein N7504_006986 [Penicillium tannophilum]|nr:hypothetical protein N7504_006986 [Penicillium tannophilum]